MSLTTDELVSRGPLGRLLQCLSSLVWWLVLIVVVLLALYVGLGRQLTQNINDYRGQVEDRLSEQLGQPVTIRRLSARWQWLDPVVELEGLTVHPINLEGIEATLQEPPARLDHLRIRLDTLTSLSRLRIVFGDFEADGLDLTINRTEDDRLTLRGISLLDPGPGRSLRELELPLRAPGNPIDVLGKWLSDPYVRITRINLGIDAPDTPVRYVDIPQVDLLYEGGRFQAAGRALRSGTTEQIARFGLVGRRFFQGRFDGQLYLEVDSGRMFDSLLRGLGWRDLSILGIDARGEGWLTFQGGQLIRANGQLQLPYLQLARAEQTLTPIEHARVHAGWRREDNQLHLRGLQWHWAGEAVAPFDLRTALDPGRLDMAGELLPLGAVSELVSALALLPGQARSALENYRPRGHLRYFTLTSTDGEPGDFRLHGELDDVGVAAYSGAPGANGVDGLLTMSRSGGEVKVDARDMTLVFPELFKDSWSLGRVQANVGFLLEDRRTRVFSDDIRVQYQETAEIAGAFDLRLDGDGEDVLGLQVGVENGRADMVADFIPARAVGDELYQWLDAALLEGDVSGTYHGKGLIGRNRPEGSFTSSMQYRFENARVRYDEAWPEVSNARGSVRVHNDEADVNLEQGSVGGLSLEPSEIRVRGNALEPVTVAIRTGARVPGEVANDWLDTTPLGELAGQAGRSLRFAGDYALDLALDIPLEENQPPLVDATVETANGEVGYPDPELLWQEVQGRVGYNSQTGFSGEAVNARFMGSPVRVSLGQTGEALQLTQRGEVKAVELARLLGYDRPQPLGISGTAAYQADLSASADSASDLRLRSDTSGLAIDWPAPLAKPAEEEVPLAIDLSWEEQGLRLSGHWGERLSYLANWDGDTFDRGRVTLGADIALPADAPGLVINGPLRRFEPEQWQNALERLTSARDSDDAETGDAPLTTGINNWLNEIDLQVKELVLAGQNFPSVELKLRAEPHGWVLESESTRARGQIFVPGEAGETVQVNLENLRLARSDEDVDEQPERVAATPQQQLEAFRALSFESWPDVSVVIDELQLNEQPVGTWSFNLEPAQDVLTVRNLTGRLESLQFDGDLVWSIPDEQETTRFTGQINGGSLMDLSGLFGSQIPLRNESSRMVLDMSWPGGPQDLALPEVEGEISMRLDDGVILESNNTAQIFRVFNLLNSDTLWRRLRFDFSDLYEAGVAFDAISGKAVLSNGELAWEPELQVVGPSGAFKLSGTTDLVAQTLDMRLVVVLPLTQNLPLAALLLGASAPIGGALFVLDKVLGDPLSKLTSATYSVGGTWENPDVDLRNVFDTGN